MILKVLLVAIVIAVVYFIVVKKKPSIKDDKKKSESQSSDMVECSTCKVYCELDEAFISGNRYYCSKECLEKKE